MTWQFDLYTEDGEYVCERIECEDPEVYAEAFRRDGYDVYRFFPW